VPVPRRLLPVLVSALLAACGGGSTDESPGSTYSVGRLQAEGAQPSPQLSENLSSWLISRVPDKEEIYLSTRTTPFSEGGRDRWAMTVRVDPALIPGTHEGATVDIRLFSNYWNDCCLNRGDPFGSSETYDRAYAAVAGTVTFRTDRDGDFDMQMQEESPARSGIFVGPVFRLKGCWRIAGEQTPSGCTVTQ
jgi:hypothetical protein